MAATAISKQISNNKGISVSKNICCLCSLIPDSKVRSKWPAIILAVIRTASVIGRMEILTVSINTINIDRNHGVPSGTRCAIVFSKLNKIDTHIKHNQFLKANVKVTDKWLLGVKT